MKIVATVNGIYKEELTVNFIELHQSTLAQSHPFDIRESAVIFPPTLPHLLSELKH